MKRRQPWFARSRSVLALMAFALPALIWDLAAGDDFVPVSPVVTAEEATEENVTEFEVYQPEVKEAAFQPQPMLAPRPDLTAPTPAPPQTRTSPGALPPGSAGAGQGGLASVSGVNAVQPGALGANTAGGNEAAFRAATDGGSLIGKSPSILGVGVQRRTPIVTDTRIRGSRVGALAASGSYWVPARIDLDTAMSKIDSRDIEQITVIKGPFSAAYGPGYDFIDFDLIRAPRFADGADSFGLTAIDYQTNGEQFHAKQSAWTGSSNWGARVDYDHRTGNDYRTGNDLSIPASYNSRELLTTLGFDPDRDTHIDFHYLRLDQTGVEFPGQAFDMNFLVTNAFDLTLVLEDQPLFDRLEFETWYNSTNFEGDNLAEGKRRQFPIFDRIGLQSFTDVESISAGYRAAATWGDPESPQLTVGTDFRYVLQELNEFSSGRIGAIPFINANSPLPRSTWVNPGVFAESRIPLTDVFRVTAGARLDFVDAEVIDDPEKLEHLGTEFPQLSLADILGADDFDQSYTLGLAYVGAERDLTDAAILRGGVGFGERAPNLTELYDAQSFMFLLQNGLNITTGDPRLKPEKVLQSELGLVMNGDNLRGSVTGFHAWMFDYITFENTGDTAQQVDLRFVNTDLATRFGAEGLAEWSAQDWLTPFATLEYVQATDQTRTGDFATRRAGGGIPSQRIPGLPRGFFGTVVGGDTEPLPSIPPLQSRAGLRFHAAEERPRWLVEVAARMVNQQNRVAASLRESTTPGFTVWDLRSHYRATDNWLLLGAVENFTDRAYREHLDFRALDGTFTVFRPGISFYFGSEVNY